MALTEAAERPAAGWRLDRWDLIAVGAYGLCAALCAGLALRALGEVGGTNSYALLADAFLHGRFDSPACFDIDCARVGEKIYVLFPPVPALVAAPLVALFGVGAKGFIVISALLGALTAWAWIGIAGRLGLDGHARLWATLAFMFGGPAVYIMLRGDAVWFFAQIVALALISFAILAALDRRLLLAGVLVGLGFLSRQMLIFFVPFLYVLALPKGASLFRIDRAAIADALKIGLPVLAAVLVYFSYNYARFGSITDNGYGHIADFPPADQLGFINWRIGEIGLFSKDYFVFNALHMFLQGFHVEFGGRYMTELVKVDPMGTSIIAASPFLLYAFYARADARLFVGLAVISVICGITLFYHSNGFSQHNVQRYALDWLPALYMLLLPVLAGAGERAVERLRMFKLLATYAIALNVAAFVLVGLTKGAL